MMKSGPNDSANCSSDHANQAGKICGCPKKSDPEAKKKEAHIRVARSAMRIDPPLLYAI